MPVDRRLIFACLGLLAITVFGTLGYVLVEGWPWFDALFMTVTTVSTVGFGETHPLSPGGRLFTILLIGSGVGAVFYLLSVLAEGLLEGHLRRLLARTAMQRAIDKLKGHVIVCGWGRFGRVVVEEVRRGGAEVVIIDQDPDLEAELSATGLGFVIGSASSDEVLERAHVGTATAIVVATASEAESVFITLAARELNPKIRVYARGESEAGVRRLIRAGAHQVASPFLMGGLRVAAAVRRPAVVDFLELSSSRREESIDLEEVLISPGSALAGRRLSEIEVEVGRLRIVAVKRSESLRLVPTLDTQIAAGDHIVVAGQHEGLDRLAALALPPGER
ncbi:MAG: potassium channel protein [Deltaproteobacteria bacterium]|nr:potassium channel protein [Deltaproteobacteria bacterium]